MDPLPEPILADSARRHGIDDEDILHAFRQWLRSFDLDNGVTMLVGPNRAGSLVEIGFVVSEHDVLVIIHAMPARQKYLR